LALSDAELMLLIKQGDEGAFTEIIDRYEQRIINFFYHLGWDFHLSEDLTQEVFIRVFKYRKKYTETATFKTFIFTIAKNLWIDYIRKIKGGPGRISLETPLAAGETEGSLKDVIPDDGAHLPSYGMDRVDLSHAIAEAVATLSEQERLIFMMVTKQGLKYREVAEILDMPEGTVKSKLYYIYRKLRDKLEALNPDEM
jgi:RNA polymerase sigma-70 factor (ECF subfamily)